MVAAATFYFDSNAQRDGSASVSTAFKFAYTKNIGSLLYGSFIITIIKIINTILDNDEDGGGNPCSKIFLCAIRCLCRMIQEIVEYLSKLGYAYMAVSGEPFCKSGWNGFILNLKYCAKFYFAQIIAAMFMSAGMFLTFAANMGIGVLMAKYVTTEEERITVSGGMLIVYLIFAFVSFTIPFFVLGLFDEGVMAILMCYSIDSELHDGEVCFGPKTYHEKLAEIKFDEDEEEEDEKAEAEEGGKAEAV